ncbi:hypothetical protein bcgnr5378_28780 [Bacillus cereus]|nr:hypothetical protein [Bacillus cereus]HDR8329067.1 hypothetical protein [Bacillus cereus]HDR8335821.1 hypothetical protein [Bacillus cereus]
MKKNIANITLESRTMVDDLNVIPTQINKDQYSDVLLQLNKAFEKNGGIHNEESINLVARKEQYDSQFRFSCCFLEEDTLITFEDGEQALLILMEQYETVRYVFLNRIIIFTNRRIIIKDLWMNLDEGTAFKRFFKDIVNDIKTTFSLYNDDCDVVRGMFDPIPDVEIAYTDILESNRIGNSVHLKTGAHGDILLDICPPKRLFPYRGDYIQSIIELTQGYCTIMK